MSTAFKVNRPNAWSGLLSRLNGFIELTKPERTLTNVMTAGAGFLLASRWHFSVVLLTELILGTTLVIASACVANNLLDRRIDKLMKRTSSRVLVVGGVDAISATVFAVLLGLVGFALLSLVNWLTFSLGIIAFLSYVFVYGYSKRKTIWSTLIGTLPGGLSLVAGYTAVTNQLDYTALMLFVLMLTWQMAHFYAIAVYRKSDYKKAGLPIWSVVKGVDSTRKQIILFEILFVGVCLVLSYLLSSWLVASVSILAGFYWLAKTLIDKKAWAASCFKASLVVLSILSFSLAISPLI